MNRLMDKKAKTVFLITLCSAMLIVHAFAKFGTSFFKMELSRTQNELEESGDKREICRYGVFTENDRSCI